MRIERRIFPDIRSGFSYVCVLAEKLEMAGWKVTFRPDINAIDILKYRYDGIDVVDDMENVINSVNTGRGAIRAIYDLHDEDRQVRWVE